MPDCEYVLSIDLGTTSIKAGIVDCKTLEVISHAQQSSPMKYPREGWAEQDPGELWSAIAEASRSALEGVSPRKIAGLVFSTYLAGVVLLDSDGRELTPIITWLDERAHGLPREVFKGPLKVAGYNIPRLLEFLRITGGAPSKTGKDPISKIVWLRENEPDAYREAKVIGGLKTWILVRTTGNPATSPDEAHLTWLADTRRGRALWSEKLARRYRIPLEKLPRILSPLDVAGKLRSDAAQDLGLEPGIPVVVGAGDVASAAVGSGAVGPAEYHIYVGTSDWIGVHTNKRLLDVNHYIGSLLSAIPGTYLVIAEQEVAGALIDWVLEVTGLNYDSLEEAARISPGSDGLLATPWLFGERCPVDDPHARGVVAGLSLRHGKLHLVRAAMEAVALNIAWAMKYMIRLAGKPKLLRGVGGGFQSKAWASIVASTVGMPVEIVHDPRHASLRGAAVIATSVLRGSDLRREASRVPIGYTAKPDPEALKVYRRLLKVFEDVYKSLGSTFRSLAELRAG